MLTVERRVSREGMVSISGNHYSVPDTTRRRKVEVQNHPTELRIYEDGSLIATHPILDGKNQRRVDPRHRKVPPSSIAKPIAPVSVAQRPLEVYAAVGKRLAAVGVPR